MSSSDAPVVRTVVNTDAIHKPKAPYNQAVVADRLVFVSGCVGLDRDGKLVPGGIKAETEQAMKNVGEILKAAGSGFDRLVKVTVLLADIADWPVSNDVYKQFFVDSNHYPARTAYQAAALPLNCRIEIEAMAIRGEITHGSQANL